MFQANSLRVLRKFHYRGGGVVFLDEVVYKDDVMDLEKVLYVNDIAFEWALFHQDDAPKYDHTLIYTEIPEYKKHFHNLSGIRRITINKPKCDCGGDKAGQGAHAHWCSSLKG